MRLTTGFFLLVGVWLMYVSGTPVERRSLFSDPVHGLLILAAVASAIAGGGLGLAALTRGEERSLAVLVSVLMGALVLYWTVSQALRGV